MHLEVAMLNVESAARPAFENDAGRMLQLIRGAAGCEGVELHKSVERAGGYTLFVRWREIEDHTVRFRQTDEFAQLVALLKAHLVAPAQMEHTIKLLDA